MGCSGSAKPPGADFLEGRATLEVEGVDGMPDPIIIVIPDFSF
jgi:hypothetical protein